MKVAALSLFFGLVALVQAQTTQTLAPSPTESIGCVPHGDHWDCEGPRVTATGSLAPTPTPDHDDDHDHDDDDHHTTPVSGAGTVSLAPSPTESFGCEPHGDHWHCEGAITAATTSAPTAAGTAAVSDPSSTAGAGRAQATGFAVAGLAAAVAALAL